VSAVATTWRPRWPTPITQFEYSPLTTIEPTRRRLVGIDEDVDDPSRLDLTTTGLTKLLADLAVQPAIVDAVLDHPARTAAAYRLNGREIDVLVSHLRGRYAADPDPRRSRRAAAAAFSLLAHHRHPVPAPELDEDGE
jgi:hypothetical protein